MNYGTETIVLLKTKEEKALNNTIIELDKKIKAAGQEYAKEKRRKLRRYDSEVERQFKLDQLEREVKFNIKQRNELQDKLYRRESCNA